jgi:hypothetical protein
MTYRNIADIFAMIERTQTRFAASVADLTEEQENYRPAPDRWTIAENAEHVCITNHGFLRLTFKLLKQAESAPKPAITDLQLPPLTMNNEGEPLPGRWKAPEMVRPQGGMRLGDAVAKNRQTISDLLALKSRLEAVDLSDQTWGHPFLGQLTLYQWLLLLGEHEERHRLQIEEIKEGMKNERERGGAGER